MAPKPIYRRPPRPIPTFALPQPWTAPLSADEASGLAGSTLIGGGNDTDRAVTGLLQTFAGQYVANLRNGRA